MTQRYDRRCVSSVMTGCLLLMTVSVWNPSLTKYFVRCSVAGSCNSSSRSQTVSVVVSTVRKRIGCFENDCNSFELAFGGYLESAESLSYRLRLACARRAFRTFWMSLSVVDSSWELSSTSPSAALTPLRNARRPLATCLRLCISPPYDDGGYQTFLRGGTESDFNVYIM